MMVHLILLLFIINYDYLYYNQNVTNLSFLHMIYLMNMLYLWNLIIMLLYILRFILVLVSSHEGKNSNHLLNQRMRNF